MSETAGMGEGGSASTELTARLRAAGWFLAAALAALVVLAMAGGLPLWSALVAFAAVAAVALAVPRGGVERRAVREIAAGATPVDRLPALRLIEAVTDPLVLIDRAGVAVHANQAARDAFGPLQGVDLLLRFRAPEMQALLRALLDGTGGRVDHAERLPLERVYRVTATPIGGDTGLFVLIFEDQSEARRIDRMRADFIANASHELRTPLTAIAGFVETLRGPARDDPAARERFLGIMQEQTARMSRLIDDLLLLSRLEMKPFVGPGERADVVAVVQAVAEALSQVAREAGVEVALSLPAEPVVVPGSRDELTQVFANLLENAIKYGRSGKRVEVSLERGEKAPRPEVAVTVRDFGPGIPAEHIPRVTERFYRVDADTSRAQKGTGLGLAIVKHILARHGARLGIASEPGQGAAFTVHLPAA